MEQRDLNRVEWALLALSFAGGLALPGCAEVAPWERGNLAKPHMALEPDPVQRALRVHAYGSREAAAGGDSAGGGGCGCY